MELSSASARASSSWARALRACTRIASLDEREHGERRHRCERNQYRGHDRPQAPTLAAGLAPLALDLVLLPPCEERLGENVVEDLDAWRAAGTVDAAQDPLAFERRDKPAQRRGRDIRKRRQVPLRMRELPTRGSHELADDPRSRILVAGRKALEASLDVGPNDRLGTAETGQRLETEPARARDALLGPQPLQHELQERRLDAIAVRDLARAALR